MRFKSAIVVGNYIKALRDKNVIIQTTDGYKFNPIVICDCSNVEFQWIES